MADAVRDLHALLNWWAAAGVTSAEADAIMAAPAPAPKAGPVGGEAKERTAPPKAPPRAAPVRKPPKVGAQGPSAEDVANGAHSLEALEQAIRQYEGLQANTGAPSRVGLDGARDGDVLLIVEPPDREDMAAGRPGAGPAGRLMDLMLAEIGLSRSTNLLVAPILFCPPALHLQPSAEDFAQALPFVVRTIELMRPKALLIADGTAAASLLGVKEALAKCRGQKFTFETKALTTSVNAMVMLSPAYLLRRPQDKRLAWADLLDAESWLDSLGVRRKPAR